MIGQSLAIGPPVLRIRGHLGRPRSGTLGHPGGTLIALVALYACWGSSIPAMKVAATTLPPLATAGAVFLLGGLILISATRSLPRPSASEAGRAAGAGLLLFVGGQGLATLVLTQVTASVVALLVATIPLWMAVLAALHGARLVRATVGRLLAGFGGVMLILLTAPDAALGGSPIALAGACVAPVFWAAGSVVAARAEAMPRDPRVNGAIQLVTGGLALLGLAAVTREFDPAGWADASGASLAAAGFLLVADSLIGFLLYAHLLRTAPLPLVSTYAYVTPVIAAALGFVVLDEPVWLGAFAGAVIVLGAVAAEIRSRPR